MSNITDALIEHYQHPRIKMIVGLTTIYENDIVSGSFSYKAGVTDGGAFAPGGCVTSSCSFTVLNRDGSYTNLFSEGTGIAVYIGYGATPQTAVYDTLAVVYVADVNKSNYKISVKCFDKLRQADKVKFTSYNFPMTVNEIITAAAGDCYITVSQLPTTGGSISVDLRDSDGNQPSLNMTCRQAIAAALLISGNFGYVNTQGALVCGWFGSSADYSIDASKLMDYNISDGLNYTGVQVYGQTPTGTTDKLYKLSSSQFLTADNAAAVQARLYEALVNYAYDIRIGSYSMLCNPNIRPGHNLQITMPQAGSSLITTVPITSITIGGSLKANYKSETITTDKADDIRQTTEETSEAVAQGDYPTQEQMETYVDNYVDDAISHIVPVGGGEVETIWIPSTTYKWPRFWYPLTDYVMPPAYISTGGWASLESLYNTITCVVRPQAVVVPKFSATDEIDTELPAYTKKIKFSLPLAVYIIAGNGSVMFGGVVSFMALCQSADDIRFVDRTTEMTGTNEAVNTVILPKVNRGTDDPAADTGFLICGNGFPAPVSSDSYKKARLVRHNASTSPSGRLWYWEYDQ